MKHWFSNLKFRYKLMAGMIAITTLALLLISQLSYSYFYKRNTREVHTKAEHSVQMAKSTLSNQLTSVAAAADHLLLKDPFPEMISDINTGIFSGYSEYFSMATSQTDTFLQNHDIVNNVLIYGEDNILFTPSALGIGRNFKNLFQENLTDCTAITVLPSRSNTLYKQGGAIPIVYPVFSNKLDTTSPIRYGDVDGMRKVRFILLLDTAMIHSYFDRMSNGYTYCMYLADKNGNPIDLDRSLYPDAMLPEVKKWVSEVTSFKEDTIPINGDDLFIASDTMKFSGLRIVHITKKSALTGDINELREFFTGVWLVCTMIAALLAFALSHLLTRKIKVLGGIIAKINTKTYEEKVVFERTDEISMLGAQLNQMYDTIQLQLEQIKEEEQKKAKAEIQMMSEQIKPHFLYNTLECIHFQILNGNTKTAAGMLESLGKSLRTTLSVGSTFITIEKEVEHVTSYMEIMNRHSSSGIRFVTNVDSSLAGHKIMKIILQPLAENCIKHGFGGSVTGGEVTPAQITVSISPEGDSMVRIEVSDNGKGIDIEKARACLLTEQPGGESHFGLHNIYKRLQACYGSAASMDFTSIPYFKNSVILVIPYQWESKSGRRP